MLASLDPPMLYVTVTGNACGLVNVTCGDGAFWQTDVVPLINAVGVGLTVTFVETGPVGPPQPFAVTLIRAVPLNVEAKLTVAVDPVPVIVLSVPDTVQLKLVAFEAVVDTVIDAVPWQRTEAEGTGTVGIPTLAGTVTVPLAHAVVLHVPEALT